MALFPLHIAKRYIISKKSHNSINIISGISVLGVTIATAAMVCILSVFNGFEDMVADLFTAFDPELKVQPAEGKYVSADDPVLKKMRANEAVGLCVDVVEDKALIVTNNFQQMVTIKGVDDSFLKKTDFKDILLGDGELKLHDEANEYGVLGVNVLTSLGLTIDFPDTLDVYAPKKGEHISLTNPLNDFNCGQLLSPSVAFMVMQAKYDNSYVLTSIDFARNLFEKDSLLTGIELSLNPSADVDKVKNDLEKMADGRFKVVDRYEQQADIFKIMEVEKLVSYIFLTFIILIACFNIISSLSMLIIDKREDIKTLHNLGASNKEISRIFLFEGWLISIVGAVVGIIVGVVLCLIQEHFGVLKFGDSAGNYITDVYPVSMQLTDIVIIFITVVVVGLLSVWYPVKYFSRRQIRTAD